MAKRLTTAESAAIEREIKKLVEANGAPMSTVGLPQHYQKLIKTARKKQTEAERRLVSERAKSRLAIAGVAHDLKTPIAVIMGAAECLKDGLDDKDYLDVISEKAAQMSETVGSIVEAARQETREERTFKELVAARDFFKTQVLRHKVFADRSNVRLKLEPIPKVFLEIDVAKMARAVQNLITNAVKYTVEGGKVTVKFSVTRGKLKVTVADNGRGIAKENLPFVFDKFYMEDSSRSHGGSGLGLYVTKDIIEEHGGTIGVRNRFGGGSVFYFYLPVAEDDGQKDGGKRRVPRGARILLTCLFFFVEPWLYRFVRFFNSFRGTTLFGAFFCIPFFMFMWLIDAISIGVYDKPVFLAD